MPERFFLDHTPGIAGTVLLEGPLAHHVARSLRMRAGDSIIGVDPTGREHGVVLTRVSGAAVEGRATWSRNPAGEPRLRITVVQALPRERMEDCIDILVQAGAAAVRPVLSERVVSRAEPGRLVSRLTRWQAVARESAQLAGRGVVPTVHEPGSLAQALEALDGGSRLVACTIDGERPLAALEVRADVPLALCIGPEGGFGPRDLEVLRARGAEPVHMGARVVRARYAGAIACALLLARAAGLDPAPASDPIP